MRLLNAVPEFNLEHGTDIRTIALSTPTRTGTPGSCARPTKRSASAPPRSPTRSTDRQKHAYLDYERLEKALVESRADAVWVGWGFVSEHAEFAALCERLGVVFIGPSSDVIRRLGDKVASKQLAERAGVPVVPWGGGPAPDLDEARAQADEIGYPLLVKAAAGGGGTGHPTGRLRRAASRPPS